jgi:hypothetical protein
VTIALPATAPYFGIVNESLPTFRAIGIQSNWEAEIRATGNVPVDLKDDLPSAFEHAALEGLGLPNILRIFGAQY